MADNLTETQKISHLLRRLGLGAGSVELEKYQPLGLQGTIDRLIDFHEVDEGFTVSPWSFFAQPDNKIYRDPYQVATWWALRFLMSERPLQEKLTLFWHDHFAVSGEKVFEGVTMLGYNEILRKYGSGKFRDLLSAVSRHGALVSYLDAHTSTRSHPNENFAREMLELFTLGLGNYEESDVREAARAFTGWSLHYGGLGDETPFETQADRAIRQKMAILNFCVVPAMHDSEPKKIFNQLGSFDGDDVLKLLAERTETARTICRKLWEFFAYENPEPSVVEALVQSWKETDGQIKFVLRSLVEQPEFWSEKCVLTKPKSPLDFSAAVFRSLGLHQILRSMVGSQKVDFEPVKEDLRKAGQGLLYLMAQQGMTLLFPPNVGGWEWGKAWISANNTLSRVNHAQLIFWSDDPKRPIAVLLAQKIKSRYRAASHAEIIDFLVETFDAQISETDRAMLVEACKKHGGLAALETPDGAAGLISIIMKLVFASPRFQLC